MDIEYLLLLQKFREGTEAYLAPVMDSITKFSVSFWPFIIVCMIYLVLDRNAGRRMLAGQSLGFLLNGFLKLTCCVYRPWIRDARIEPFGDSKIAATGYSFPSGHAMCITAWFGATSAWFWKKAKAVSVLLILTIFAVMFSRNYLGVHTPQDVLVSLFATSVMLIFGYLIENWTDKDPQKRDIIVMISGLILCVAILVYYLTKSYPMDYLEDGSLLVDPKKMLPDSFEGLGFVSSFCICRYFERRGFDFDKEMNRKDRFIVSVFCMIPLAIYYNGSVAFFTDITGNKCIGKFLWSSVMVVFVMIVIPSIMKLVNQKGYLKSKQKE